MSNERAMYWLMQVAGWFLFIVLILLQNILSGAVDVGIWKFLVLNFLLGLAISHGMRYVIIRFTMLRMRIAAVIGYVILLSILGAFLATAAIFIVQNFIFQYEQNIPLSIGAVLSLVFPFMVVFLIWNILYFAANYLKNYEREEIKNLRLSASMTEVELLNLRTQLNPHFMFNALNSIRALVDENPALAKRSITRLSLILRSSLTSGRHPLVPLTTELKMVIDYLELEKIRFEERLKYFLDIPEHLMQAEIPPLLLQTIVENAVKHGIGSRKEGGEIRISVSEYEPDGIRVLVFNSGDFDPEKTGKRSGTGTGLSNSRRRLKLLYGKRSSLTIANTPEGVACTLIIPSQPQKEYYELPDH